MTAEPELVPVEQAPQLRLFTPEGGEGGEGAGGQITLGELFEQDFLPIWIRGRHLDPKTEEAYRQSLRWWERLTDNPVLSEIDDHTVARFVDQLCAQAGRREDNLSMYTVRRHCSNIGKLLSFAGPKGREKHSRKNRGILSDPPWVEAPETQEQAPQGHFALSEIHALYWACGEMTRPRVYGVEPAWWWRAMLVVGYFTGLRRGQLLDMEFSQLAIGPTNGSINVSPRRGKRKKGYTKYLPLLALEHIQRIRSERQFIFQWPTCPRQLSHHFDKLLRCAGLEGRCGAGDKFHGLRKTHTSMIGALDPQQMLRVAQASAGHSNLAVTLEHYVAGAVQDLVQARAVDSMPSPVPPDFVDSHERQRLLF